MRLFFGALITILMLGACVPAKKYNELLAKQENCQDQLKKYKTSSLDNEARLKTLQTKADLMQKDIDQLKSDTAEMGESLRLLRAKYDQALLLGESFQKKLNEIKNSDAKQLAKMQADLQSKILEAQHKEDALIELENKLNKKEKLLAEREQRVIELEEIIQRQKDAVNDLKERIADALRGFKDKGIQVEVRNGKVYVSLEAKLLFPSGSTVVNPEGKKAIIDLSKAIENEKDLEIIVEGHTDTDKMVSATHPTNNWELSVLRSTSIIDIMTKNSNIDPALLMAAGRSEYHPVDPNNKAKNRRIEVIIAPNLDKLFQLISEE